MQDESKWKKFIFETEPVESPANELDCSFLCKNVQKWKPCDLFVFKVSNYLILYLPYHSSREYVLVEKMSQMKLPIKSVL